MKRRFTFCAPVIALLACACMLGCGGSSVNHVAVSGTVTFNGKPLECGSITFVSADGETPTGGGQITKGGIYKAQVPPGAKKVLVTSYKVVGSKPEYPGMANSPMIEERASLIPPAYNAKHLTPLSAEITESQDDLDFAITSNP